MLLEQIRDRSCHGSAPRQTNSKSEEQTQLGKEADQTRLLEVREALLRRNLVTTIGKSKANRRASDLGMCANSSIIQLMALHQQMQDKELVCCVCP